MTDDKRHAVKTHNPQLYQRLVDLEAQAYRDPQQMTLGIWIDAYGHTLEMVRGINAADCMAEFMRRSMTDEGWIAGPHRFTPDKVIFVTDTADGLPGIMARLLKLIEDEYGPRLPSP